MSTTKTFNFYWVETPEGHVYKILSLDGTIPEGTKMIHPTPEPEEYSFIVCGAENATNTRKIELMILAKKQRSEFERLANEFSVIYNTMSSSIYTQMGEEEFVKVSEYILVKEGFGNLTITKLKELK